MAIPLLFQGEKKYSHYLYSKPLFEMAQAESVPILYFAK